MSLDEPEHGTASFWDELLQRDDGEDDWDTDIEDDTLSTPRLAPSSITGFSQLTQARHYDSVIEEPLAAHSDQDVHEDASPSDSDVTEKVKFILAQITAVGLTLPKFLLALSWGGPGCTSDAHIRGARTSLMNSDELPIILHHWWKPPRLSASNKSRTRAARNVMEEMAQMWLHEALDSELDEVSAILHIPDDVSEEFYTSTKFNDLAKEIEKIAPVLWLMLQHSAYTEKQEKKKTRKNATKVTP
jgi:hypothetical protein